MLHALALARQAEQLDEVPVGAVLVANEEIVGEGFNCPIDHHDPTAHAEIMALRAAGNKLANYRLPDTTLYVTLEPCVMCAGAIVHARVSRVVFAASDLKTGAAGSVFDLLPSDKRFNHHTRVAGGLFAEESAALISGFFQRRRLAKKAEKMQRTSGLM